MQNTVKTDTVQQSRLTGRSLDQFDRKILGLLAADAEASYVQLGHEVGLSAPAVHDRVKKLRMSGHLRRTVAILDGPAIGKPLLAFVQVDCAGWCATDEMIALTDLPEIEEIHSVAGDSGILIKVRCASTLALEALLAKIYAVPGVKGTRTNIVLSTYLERTTQAAITDFANADPQR
jgi:Lrp/AsnC family transcriptional regulator, leucine-responsive regulatory protein